MFCFYLIYFHDFSQAYLDGRQPTFFVYWFLDEVRSIKEAQKTSGPFWIYISIFTQPIWFIHVSLFFNFYCNIYNVTNPIIDVYEVNNGRHYQSQINVWEDINRLLYDLIPDLLILAAIQTERQPKYSNKDI